MGVLSNEAIDRDLIAPNYDQMIKYATALRLKTAEAHQMLRRFARGGPKHPTSRPSRNWDARSVRSSSASTWPANSSVRKSTRA